MLNLIKKLVLTKQEYSIITENEKWLRETELRMDHLINKTDEIICTFSSDGRLLFGNKSFRKSSQYEKNDFHLLTVDNLLSTGSKANVYENLMRLSQGESLQDVICKFIAKDGTVNYVQGSVIPVFDEGVFKGSQAFFRIINDRIEINKRRLEYLSTLEEMLFALSHKVRKPVATCLGLVEVLNAEEKLTEETIKTYAGFLNTSIHELDYYVREMSNALHERRIQLTSASAVKN